MGWQNRRPKPITQPKTDKSTMPFRVSVMVGTHATVLLARIVAAGPLGFRQQACMPVFPQQLPCRPLQPSLIPTRYVWRSSSVPSWSDWTDLQDLAARARIPSVVVVPQRTTNMHKGGSLKCCACTPAVLSKTYYSVMSLSPSFDSSGHH